MELFSPRNMVDSRKVAVYSPSCKVAGNARAMKVRATRQMYQNPGGLRHENISRNTANRWNRQRLEVTTSVAPASRSYRLLALTDTRIEEWRLVLPIVNPIGGVWTLKNFKK